MNLHSVIQPRLNIAVRRTPMARIRARTARLWSAETRHRFPSFGDLSPKQCRTQCRIEVRGDECGVERKLDVSPTGDGDNSPAEGGKESFAKSGVSTLSHWVNPQVVTPSPRARIQDD